MPEPQREGVTKGDGEVTVGATIGRPLNYGKAVNSLGTKYQTSLDKVELHLKQCQICI